MVLPSRPGVPPPPQSDDTAPLVLDEAYYERLKAVESAHWWTLGMTDVMTGLLRGRLPRGAGARVLDIGCGSGIGLGWSARTIPHARRVGIDVTPHALAHCHGLGADLLLASAEAIPLEDESVDLALCIDVLQHVEQDEQAIREAARVLRPGASFFVRTNALSLAKAPPGSRLYTPRRLRQLMNSAGLTVDRCSRTNSLGAVLRDLRSALRRRPPDGHEHAAHRTGHSPQEGPFRGGGYGGGLRIAPESSQGVLFRSKRALLRWEGAWIRLGGALPYGHSIVCVAHRPV